MSRKPAERDSGARKKASRSPAARPRAKQPKEPRQSPEPISQVTIKMRESLHRELARQAFNSEMTMRGFIMRALKQAGLGVTESDLVDGRKKTLSR